MIKEVQLPENIVLLKLQFTKQYITRRYIVEVVNT
jgi:hypothetical protein